MEVAPPTTAAPSPPPPQVFGLQPAAPQFDFKPYIPPPREPIPNAALIKEWGTPLLPPPPPPPIPPTYAEAAAAKLIRDSEAEQQRVAAQKALDMITRHTGQPPAAKTNWRPSPATVPWPTSGKPTAVNFPVPQRPAAPGGMQLPAQARVPKIPKPVKRLVYKGLEIGWNGAKWVAKNPHKAAWRGLDWYGRINLAIDLAQWASGQLPGYRPPPKVETKYEFSGGQMGMTYRHFDGSYQHFPPPGYDRFGNLEK